MDNFLEILFSRRQNIFDSEMSVERRIRLDEIDKIIYEYKVYLMIQERQKD